MAEAEIKVYDNNNQYLGVLLDYNPAHLVVFIPSLAASWEFDTRSGAGCPETDVVFESADCSGTPYMWGPHSVIFDLNTLLGEFYKADYSGKKNITPASSYDDDCQCRQDTWKAMDYYPMTNEVQMPFTTPIALPLRFEVRTRAVVIPLN